MHANQTDQLVAFVDRKHVVLCCRISARITQTVDQQYFYIRLHLIQDRVARHNVVPGFERKQRFSRARGARIERDNAVLKATAEEKRHVNRNHQTTPFGVGKIESGKGTYPPRHTFVLHTLPTKEKSAGIAGAEQLASRYFNQVGMV